jgi:hypothetical protein
MKPKVILSAEVKYILIEDAEVVSMVCQILNKIILVKNVERVIIVKQNKDIYFHVSNGTNMYTLTTSYDIVSRIITFHNEYENLNHET